MTDNFQDWQEKNSQYLSLSMDWLRLKLRQMQVGKGKDKANTDTSVDEQALNRALAGLADLESGTSLPALAILKRQFDLSAFEQQVLLLCAAMELDTGIPGLCAKALDDPNKPFPTFALAMSLFEDPTWDAISTQRPLRYWRLIEVIQMAGQALISSPLRGDERIINFIKGLNYLDDRIARMSSPFETAFNDITLPASQEEIVAKIADNINQSEARQIPAVIQLVGNDTLSKQLVAQKIATKFNFNLINIPLDLLPTQAMELEEFARLWQRESLLLPIVGYIDAHQTGSIDKSESHGQQANNTLQRMMSLSRGKFLISTPDVRSELHASSWIIDVKKPTVAEQESEWSNLLGKNADNNPYLLAAQFNLNATTIREIVARVDNFEKPAKELHAELWKNCLAQTSPDLEMLVQKLDLKSDWDDIVLPDASLQQLKQISSQVKLRNKVYDNWGFRNKMNRGLGINALFVGESGTGKTMAAEVLANELNLRLYRIDLSGVVSKYIGETEKNLRRVFDAAENGGAILFFDEADALFGKRSEVKDSHDRYANIEVNYLLQRIESYNGLAILATNKKTALDQAFVRRLRFIVSFPFPGVNERKAILQKVFPKKVPTLDLDYDRLAALNLTGGSLHNIAINAAFNAMENGGPVTMPLMLAAARAEFQKIERPVKESDFIWNE